VWQWWLDWLHSWSARKAWARNQRAPAVSTEEVKLVARGWSAKKKIMGKPVYNDQNQKIGTVDDLIITPDKSVSYAIIGVGGFLGIGKHDVAIPANQLKEEHGKLILPGATKETLKAMPKFEYTA
jgi:sporulation protein YlmC with PRC-barrel domain